MKITKQQLWRMIEESFNEGIPRQDQRVLENADAQDDIRDAIQMLEAEEDITGTLFHVINRLYEALEKMA